MGVQEVPPHRNIKQQLVCAYKSTLTKSQNDTINVWINNVGTNKFDLQVTGKHNECRHKRIENCY